MNPDEMLAELLRLLATEQITDRLHAYCRGVDRIDLDLIRSVFHADARADYGDMFQGTGHEFAGFIERVHPPMQTHSHHLSNVVVAIDGETAGSEAYVIVRARTLGEDGVVFDTHAHGRYVDRWQRRGGEWRISHRRYLHSLDAISQETMTMFPPLGSRDLADASYEVLGQ